MHGEQGRKSVWYILGAFGSAGTSRQSSVRKRLRGGRFRENELAYTVRPAVNTAQKGPSAKEVNTSYARIPFALATGQLTPARVGFGHAALCARTRP